jgi:hypothetical protein
MRVVSIALLLLLFGTTEAVDSRRNIQPVPSFAGDWVLTSISPNGRIRSVLARDGNECEDEETSTTNPDGLRHLSNIRRWSLDAEGTLVVEDTEICGAESAERHHDAQVQTEVLAFETDEREDVNSQFPTPKFPTLISQCVADHLASPSHSGHRCCK